MCNGKISLILIPLLDLNQTWELAFRLTRPIGRILKGINPITAVKNIGIETQLTKQINKMVLLPKS